MSGSMRLQSAIGLAFVAVLSFLAGLTDAIGFIAGGDFVSFMSGNTTRLAIAIGNGHAGDIVRLCLILLVFVLGNAIGIVVTRITGIRIWPLLAMVTGLLATSAVANDREQAMLTLFPAVLAMGSINAAVEAVAGVPVGLTYVTGALSRFGKGLGRMICGERGFRFAIHIIPWLGMFAGAVVGTILQLSYSTAAFWTGAGLAGFLTFGTLVLPYRWQAPHLGARD